MSIIEDKSGRWGPMRDALKMLGVRQTTLDNLIAQGRIRKRQVPGAKARVALDDVQRLLDECTTARTDPE